MINIIDLYRDPDQRLSKWDSMEASPGQVMSLASFRLSLSND